MPGFRVPLAIALALAPSIVAGAAAASSLQIQGFTFDRQGNTGAIQVLRLRSGGPVPADGLAPNVGRWYIGSLDQIATAIATSGAARDRAMAERRDDAAPRAIELAMHPTVNPSGHEIEARCDLPGSAPARLELFDVLGRHLAVRELSASNTSASVRLVAPGPGVYWLKLSQGARTIRSKVVVTR